MLSIFVYCVGNFSLSVLPVARVELVKRTEIRRSMTSKSPPSYVSKSQLYGGAKVQSSCRPLLGEQVQTVSVVTSKRGLLHDMHVPRKLSAGRCLSSRHMHEFEGSTRFGLDFVRKCLLKGQGL